MRKQFSLAEQTQPVLQTSTSHCEKTAQQLIVNSSSLMMTFVPLRTVDRGCFVRWCHWPRDIPLCILLFGAWLHWNITGREQRQQSLVNMESDNSRDEEEDNEQDDEDVD